MEVLRVSVNRDKLNSLYLGVDHVVKRILAGTAATEDFYPRKRFNIGGDLGHKKQLIAVSL